MFRFFQNDKNSVIDLFFIAVIELDKVLNIKTLSEFETLKGLFLE